MTSDAGNRACPVSRRLPSWRQAAVALLLAGQALRTPHLAAQSPSTPESALATTIDRVIADPAFERGHWGISIRSLATGATLYEHDAGKLMMPASTLKLLTLAVAADRLGWEYSYDTSLWHSGTIIEGVLHGDLVVIGSGDPTLDDWDGKATMQFADWAGRLKALGIRRVEGRVLGNDNAFDDLGYAPGWSWDDLAASYAASVGGLQFNENTAILTIRAGAAGAAPISVDPPFAPVEIRNHLGTTSPAPGPVQVLSTGSALEVNGSPGPWPQARRVAVANPTLYFTRAFRSRLLAEGIDVSGPAEDVDELSTPIDGLLTHVTTSSSPPLREFSQTRMKMSQNLFAESLVKTLGIRSAAQGATAAGVAAIRETALAWGVAADELAIVDGSGLSRYNLMTARAMTTVLAHVTSDDRLKDAFMRSLPVAGLDGTLQGRMRGTRAAGLVRAKTGSFGNARALSGVVETLDRETLVFTIVANNYNTSPAAIDAATDAIVVALADFRR